MDKKINFKIILIPGYFLLLSFLHWGFSFNWGEILVVIGGVAGFCLLEIDNVLYVFLNRPEEEISKRARGAFFNKNYRDFFKILAEVGETKNKRILHSFIFAPVDIILAIYIITSSGSPLAAGLVLGLLLSYTIYIFNLFRKEKQSGTDLLSEKVFWNAGFLVDERIKSIFITLLFSFFVFASILFIR